jgi:hypothetical protein
MPVYMGNQNIESDGSSTWQNKIFCEQCTLSVSAALQSISIYIATTYTTDMRMAVYADSSGSPGALKAETAEWSVVSTGWNTRLTTTNPILPAGTYWLAWKYKTDSIVMLKRTDTGSTKKRNLTYSSGSFPDPAGSGWMDEVMLHSWYAELLAGSVPVFFRHLQEQGIA